MPLEIIREDITKMKTDAIVNAANQSLSEGGGVCGAIFKAAGRDKLRRACQDIGKNPTGEAVITEGFDLPARYIIHTTGPIWQKGEANEAELLSSCYKNSLELAKENNLSSIAFPLISSGIYGYPKAQALSIATKAISDFLLENEMEVYLVIFDRDSFLIGKDLYSAIQSYIDENYVKKNFLSRKELEKNEMPYPADSLDFVDFSKAMPINQVHAEEICEEKSHYDGLAELINRKEESFSQMLFRLIDERGLTDAETYKRANLDRRHFSKIRKENYNPSKSTVLALAIALRLSADDTSDLLLKAGYALSPSHKADIIVEYFITHKNYDIFEINEALFVFEQPLLGRV